MLSCILSGLAITFLTWLLTVNVLQDIKTTKQIKRLKKLTIAIKSHERVLFKLSESIKPNHYLDKKIADGFWSIGYTPGYRLTTDCVKILSNYIIEISIKT